MAVPGTISPDGVCIRRGHDSVEIETATAAVQKLSLVKNRACFVKGTTNAMAKVDLLGEQPPQVASAQAECDRMLGTAYFAGEESFLVPERATLAEAERLVLHAISGIRTPWERTKIEVVAGDRQEDRGGSAAAPAPRKRPERPDSAADETAAEAQDPPQPKRIGISPGNVGLAARPVPAPAPARSPEEIEKARRRLGLDKLIEALEIKRARVIRTMNKTIQKRMVPGIDRQIAEHSDERDRLV